MYDTFDFSNKSFNELIALFSIEIQDDIEFYNKLSYHLAKKNRQKFKDMIPDFSNHRQRAAIWGLEEAISEDINFISQYVMHSDPMVVEEAINALRWLGVEHWKPIGEALHHASANVRCAALRFAQGRLGETAKLLLIDCLKDSDVTVRTTALKYLTDLASALTEQDIEKIKICLKDKDEYIRIATEDLIKSIE